MMIWRQYWSNMLMALPRKHLASKVYTYKHTRFRIHIHTNIHHFSRPAQPRSLSKLEEGSRDDTIFLRSKLTLTWKSHVEFVTPQEERLWLQKITISSWCAVLLSCNSCKDKFYLMVTIVDFYFCSDFVLHLYAH